MNATSLSKAGWVVRDERGIFRFAGQALGNRIFNAMEVEFQALINAMQHCWSLGYTKIILEGDNQKMMDILNNKVLHFGMYNWIREVRWWSRLFQEVEFRWVKRQANMVAEKLAKGLLHLCIKTMYVHNINNKKLDVKKKNIKLQFQSFIKS